ncbi:transcriptional regulator [Candidatus Saccharibacteria bacterium]|nr:transcriptional regulator [Candidatus Saccharibacteria bacterium]
MARLEELGYITSPHTSAGRIPTDYGYRYYVNSLSSSPHLGNCAETDAQDSDSSETESGKPTSESILNSSDSAEAIEIIDSIFNHWLNPSPLKALGSGEENEGRRSLHALEVRINAQERADFAIRSAVDMLVELTGNLGLATIGNQLYYSGISKLFSQPEFVDYGRIQAVSKLLDNLEPWLHEAKPGEPLNIFIGHENPIGKNSDASLIISKFRSPYSDDSYIGVLGPTRQNYAKIMSLVRHAGRYLENTL